MLRETHLFRMAAGCVLMFLAGSPYLLLDYGRALHDLRSLQASTSMGMTPPELLGRGWTYHLPHSLWYGVGWPMLFSALAGMVWMAARHPGPALVLGSFPVAYYVAAGAGYNVFVRYMIPVVPFLCIFAGYFVASAASAIAPAMRLRPALVAAALGLAVAAPPAINVVQFDRLLTQEDSRISRRALADRERACAARRCSSAGIATVTQRSTSCATVSSASTTAATRSRPIGGRPASCRSGW